MTGHGWNRDPFIVFILMCLITLAIGFMNRVLDIPHK